MKEIGDILIKFNDVIRILGLGLKNLTVTDIIVQL